MTNEREMLVGEAGAPDKSLGIRMRKRGRRLRRFFAGALTLIALVIGAGWLFGPKLAARLAEREYPFAVEGGQARIIVEDVHLGWGGPQRVGRLRVEDAQGATLAELSVESTASLLGAYRSRDLGVITLRGSVELSEEQLMSVIPARTDEGVVHDASAPPLSGSPRARSLDQLAIRLPRGWRGSLEARELNVRYLGANEDLRGPMEITGLNLWVSYDGHSQGDIRIETESPPLRATIAASSLAGADGLVELDRAKIDVDLSARLPGWIVESATRIALGGAARASAARAAASEDTLVEAHLRLRDGRLTLADDSDGVRVSAPLPAAIAGLIEGGPREIQWVERPSARLVVDRLDVPLVGAQGASWSSGAITMSIETSVGAVFAAYDLEAAPQLIELKPGRITITSDDLASGVSVDGTWELAVGRRAPAGIRIEGQSGPLLTENGSFRTDVPEDLVLNLSVHHVPTSLFEPWANRQGITLQDWLGGDVNSRLTVRTRRDESTGGALAADVELEGNAPFADWWAIARVSEHEISFPGRDSIRFKADNVAPLARVLLIESELELAGSGLVLASASDVHVPLVGGLPDLHALRGVLSVDVGDFVIPQGAGAEPLTIKSLWTEVEFDGINPVRASLNHQVRIGTEDMRAHGTLDIRELISSRTEGGWPWIDVDPSAMRIDGALWITDLPSSLASSAAPEWIGSVRQIAGRDLDVQINFNEGHSALADVTLTVSGENGFEASAGIVIGDLNEIHVENAAMSFTATPALALEIANVLDRDDLRNLTLERDVRFTLNVEPISLTRPEGSAGDAWSISPAEMTLITENDVVLRRDDSDSSEMGVTIAARNLSANAALVIANRVQGSVSISSDFIDLTGDAESPIGSVLASMESTGEAGWRIARARLESSSLASLDRLAGADGMIEEILGEQATIELAPAGEGLELINLSIISERTSGSAQLDVLDDRLVIQSPARFESTLSPALANKLLGLDASAEGPRVSQPTPLEVVIQRFSAGRGSRQPMDAEAFEMDLTITSPELGLESAAGERVGVEAIVLQLKSTDEPGAIDVQLQSGALTSSTGSIVGPAAALRIHGLADSRGAIGAGLRRITGTLSGGAPTVLLDDASGARGLVLDLLGPTVQLEIEANDLSRLTGEMLAVVQTDFVEARVSGSPRGDVFYGDDQIVVTLHRVAPQVSARILERLMPLIDGVEKTTDDEPAIIRASGLAVPMDGDLRKLSGNLEVDLGTVRFSTSGLIAKLLESTHNRSMGELGRRVEPFDIAIRQGVATYDDTMIPMGEFNIRTRGTIDLAGEQLDLVLFIPLFALADEVAKDLGATPGLDRLAMIPFRIRGDAGNPKVNFAPDLLPQGLIPGFIQQGAEEVGGEAGELIKDVGRVLQGIGRELSGKNKKPDRKDEGDDDDDGG